MIFVETLLEKLLYIVLAGHERDAWKANFITNVAESVETGRALTTAQAEVVLKLAKAHAGRISAVMNLHVGLINDAINAPQYSKPLVQSLNIPREVRYLGGNMIAFRFKMDQTVTTAIKNLRSAPMVKKKAYFNRAHKVWVVYAYKTNIDQIQSIIKQHKFSYDQALLAYILQVTQNKENVPSVTYNDVTGNLAVAVPNSPLFVDLLEAALGGEVV